MLYFVSRQLFEGYIFHIARALTDLKNFQVLHVQNHSRLTKQDFSETIDFALDMNIP